MNLVDFLIFLSLLSFLSFPESQEPSPEGRFNFHERVSQQKQQDKALSGRVTKDFSAEAAPELDFKGCIIQPVFPPPSNPFPFCTPSHCIVLTLSAYRLGLIFPNPFLPQPSA